MACNITKLSLIESIKNQIIKNATSYVEYPTHIFIPISTKLNSLNLTREVANRKINELNSKYNSNSYGEVVSIGNASNGTLIHIHPTQHLVDDLNFISNFQEDEALTAQDIREEYLFELDYNKSNVLESIKNKEFKNKNELITYLRESTNPMLYKLIYKDNSWKAELREEYIGIKKYLNKLEDCR